MVQPFATAAKLNAAKPGSVAGLLLIYPLLELGDEASSVFAHSRIVGRAAVSYIRHQLQLKAPTQSLGESDLAPVPPSLIVTGGALDPCRPDAQRLAARLDVDGKLTGLLEYPRLPHGFASMTHVSRASGRAVGEIGERLADLVTQVSAQQTQASDDRFAPATGPAP
ncbi:MAG TPA: alpha/beta hydrolase fold domain-containing protein [Caulobacteraceae bacterium]